MTEVWRGIPGWEGEYSVNRAGAVRSEARVVVRSNGRPNSVRQRILAPKVHRGGQRSVCLARGGHGVSAYVHLLVAEAFGPERKK